MNYFRDLPDRIQQVSAEEVQQAAREYIKPEEMVIVAVGDRSRIEPELSKLNLGPIEIRDADGNPK